MLTIAKVLGVRVRWKVDGTPALLSGPGSSRVRVGKFETSFSAAQALREKSRQRKLPLFGSGSWGPELAGTGRYRALVGKPLGSLQIVGSVPASATIDSVGSKLVRAFPKRSQLIPSPLTGSVSGLHPCDAIAVALNGQSAAVSVVYRGPHFSALVPESAFRTGRNSVRAFLVTGSPPSPQLRELRVRLSGT